MSQPKVAPRKVLILDEPNNDYQTLENMFIRDGFQITITPPPTGASSINIIKKEKPDIVVLKTEMKGLSGYEVCSRLKKERATSDIPVIFLTPSRHDLDMERLFEVGAHDYIVQPLKAKHAFKRIHTISTLRDLQERSNRHDSLLQKHIAECYKVETALKKTRAELDHTNNEMRVIASLFDHVNKQLAQTKQQLNVFNTLDKTAMVSNRAFLLEYLEKEWRHLCRNKSPLSILLCDIDYFKKYNSQYGRIAGDACLRKVAESIRKAIERPMDLVGRYSEDDFIIILPDTDMSGSEKVARKVAAELKAIQLAHHLSPVNQFVTMSIGVSYTIPDRNHRPELLIEAARDALLEAKKKGRNGFASRPFHPDRGTLVSI